MQRRPEIIKRHSKPRQKIGEERSSKRNEKQGVSISAPNDLPNVSIVCSTIDYSNVYDKHATER